MSICLSPANVVGLTPEEQNILQELLEVYNDHAVKNFEKEKYYEGKISLREVNLGIALPDSLARLEIGCAWGAKTVDVLAARSMFDGFVTESGNVDDELVEIAQNNHLIAEYQKACRDELKTGCSFATLSADPAVGVKIRFHSSRTAAAVWDGEKGRIKSGFAIIDTVSDDEEFFTPTVINLYTDDAIIVMVNENQRWYATRFPHKMKRPLMVPLIYNPTSTKPFGQSRIKEPIRRLIQGYVRTVANATVGLEFATSPQKYLLGVTDEQFDAVVNDKFRQYVGAILTSTNNPETGEKPTFGQLAQGNITPHVNMLRMLATQFSAATGLPVTDTGVVNDANPTSSEAIEAQTKTLVGLAEELNEGNGDALRTIGVMALAIKNNITVDELTDEQKNIIAHFKNPAMPSIAASADAAIKIATVRQGFSSTDTFLEMLGFDQADIRRIKAQEQRTRGLDALLSIEAE